MNAKKRTTMEPMGSLGAGVSMVQPSLTALAFGTDGLREEGMVHPVSPGCTPQGRGVWMMGTKLGAT